MTQEELFRLRQTGAEVQRILDAEGTMAEQAAASVGAAESANEAAQQVNDALQEIIETGDIPAATVAKVAEHTVQIGNLEALIFDISANNPTEGNPTPYANLAAALGEGGVNVPESMRKGGMSVKFVQSSDNKYVQFRCMSNEFTTDISAWQGVDAKPTAGSNNLIESGGVDKFLQNKVIVGKNNNLVPSYTYGLVVGHKYRLIVKNQNWDISGVTSSSGNSVALVQAFDNTDTQIGSNLYNCKLSNYPCLQEIEFDIPSGTSYIRFGIRATEGEKIYYNISDVTALNTMQSNLNTMQGNVNENQLQINALKLASKEKEITGNDDTYGVETITGIVPNRYYKIVFRNPSWDISGVTVGDNYNILHVEALDVNSNSLGTLASSKKGAYPSLQERILTKTPAGTVAIRVSIRATLDEKVFFYLYDDTGVKNIEGNIETINGNIETINGEIEELQAESIIIPNYYQNQVDDVISKSTNDIANVGINGDNFIFITDMHWEWNSKNSPVLIQYICNKLNIPYILFGGDAINGQDDVSVAMGYFNQIASGLKKAESNLFSVYGNHDNNATNTQFPSKQNVFYALLQKQSDMLMKYGALSYFYFDNPTNNTRYICLTTGAGSTFSSAQESWLRSLLTNTDASIHIVIVLHSYIGAFSYVVEGVTVGSEFHISVAGTAVNNIISDYPNLKFEAVFTGHTHIDYNGMTDTMVPVVNTTCDRRASGASGEEEGTVDEQAFDVVTLDYTNKLISCRRVGREKSRLIHYAPYTLNIGRTLDISSLLTIQPTSYSVRDNMIFRKIDGNVVFLSDNASIDSNGIVTAIAAGYITAVAENDDFIETFNIKIS